MASQSFCFHLRDSRNFLGVSLHLIYLCKMRSNLDRKTWTAQCRLLSVGEKEKVIVQGEHLFCLLRPPPFADLTGFELCLP